MSTATHADPLLDQPWTTALGKIANMTRVTHGLHGDHIITVRDLTKLTKDDFLRIPSLGKRALEAITAALAERGLTLRDGDHRDGTLPLPFPSIHERLSRIERRLDVIEGHSLLRVVGDMRGMTPREPD